MKILLDDSVLESNDSEEWEFLLKLIEVMEPIYLLGILEHYNLDNWL